MSSKNNSDYSLNITSNYWLKNTDDLFDFSSGNFSTKTYTLTNEDKENYIIKYKENLIEFNNIITYEKLIPTIYQNFSTKVIAVLLFNESTKNFTLINSLKYKKKQYQPQNCERMWTVISQNDYSVINEGDIIKLGRLRLKIDKINFNKNNWNTSSKSTNFEEDKIITGLNLEQTSIKKINIINNYNILKTGNEIENNETIEKINCRLCYQEEYDLDNPLLCPCKCKGSMKYIHYSCLKKSIEQKIHIKKEDNYDMYIFRHYFCEICHQTYPKYIKYKGNIYPLVDINYDKFTDYVQASIIYYSDFNINGSNNDMDNNNDNKQITYLGYIVFNIKNNQELKIGRNQSNDIILKDISISRFHCMLKREKNYLKIKDVGSKFGTLYYIQNLKIIKPNTPPLEIISGKHQFFFNSIYNKKTFSFWDNIFGTGCCTCKNELEIKTTDYKYFIKVDDDDDNNNNSQKNNFKLTSEYTKFNDIYYKRFKDNDSYNDYIIDMNDI